MKLLLDQGLPKSAAQRLRDSGIDTLHVGEIGMAAAADADIIERAKEEDRAVVTLDADFHTSLALSDALLPSVIRIRIERLRSLELTELLLRVIAECREALTDGAAVTVEPGRIRIRLLPLVANSQNGAG